MFIFFFFHDTATTETYTLSLHDALPIRPCPAQRPRSPRDAARVTQALGRSEEHTSELQSRLHLVCRLLLEKKKYQQISHPLTTTCLPGPTVLEWTNRSAL